MQCIIVTSCWVKIHSVIHVSKIYYLSDIEPAILIKKKISAAACIVALKYFLYCEWKIYMQAPYCLFFTYNYLYDCNMSICTGRYLLFGYISVIFTKTVSFYFHSFQCFSFRNKSVVKDLKIIIFKSLL